MTTTLHRIQRFLWIWRSSGSFVLAVDALRGRCQEVMVAFLRAGGRVTPQRVEYRDQHLGRQMFAGRDLAGVGYLQRFVDHGGQVAALEDAYLASLPEGLRFEAESRTLLATLGMLVERFIDEEYAWLEVAGRIVVDVGANIADSVVYFAKRGAVYVYGYEPDPRVFEAAQRNLELNGIDNAEITRVAVMGDLSGPTEDHVSFRDVVKDAAARHPGLPIICKIDCEGCEFDIFASGNPPPVAIDGVEQIMIEYHWRSPETLISALQRLGFNVKVDPGAPGVGWIRASRSQGMKGAVGHP